MESPRSADLHADDPARIAFDSVLLANPVNLATCRDALRAASENLADRFIAGESVGDLVRLRATIVDHLLIKLWQQHASGLQNRVALVAVGGYGRAQLHPHSDVDIMLLLPADIDAEAEPGLAAFVTCLWDVGLEIGHSVRTVSQCVEESATNVTTATTLMEARLLHGPTALFDAMNEALQVAQPWPAREFFEAKLAEQKRRHHRFDDTAYKLEPDVKGSPGGLRDIQIIGWIANRYLGARSFSDLVEHGYLTPAQLRVLYEGRSFLWRVRFALHLLTGRREDRLLFDHQTRLASMLGYEDATYTLAVEQLMQRYYRTIMDLSRINEMLLQLFEESIFMDPSAPAVPLNERFEVRNGYLRTRHDRVFVETPSALLELFQLLQKHGDLKGVSAHTVALVKQNLFLIDEQFRQDPRHHRLFLDILRAPTGVTHELRRMNRYGVLGLYIPPFGRIVGRMQYDLFHAYTVDEHTLFVVSNLRRFALTRFDHEYPHCSPLMQSFEKPEIAYLAGLFHDIAKGRGGDHSELGAVDAAAFCLEHGLSRDDAELVAWLVRNHLLLSMTAQKKDISDPNVVNEFAAFVGNKLRLDYLYVLTVADVRGTNPRLWNNWKATLFQNLYELAARALREGLDNPIRREQLIQESHNVAEALLTQQGIAAEAVEAIWALLPDDYFLRYSGEEIAWHTERITEIQNADDPVFADVRLHADGIAAVLYARRSQHRFAHATAALGEMGMTILDARITPVANGCSLDTYVFMELDARTEIDNARLAEIRRSLDRVLAATDASLRKVTRPAPRRVRAFVTKTAIDFTDDRANQRTIMELVAGDRPGLLSDIARIFIEQGIDIETAKILTIGERAEDVFYITDASGKPLDNDTKTKLREALLSR
ncbi:MAG TPA: [protein-PII] uridylyltransferase, partial [Woeseiaceae bacterium]